MLHKLVKFVEVDVSEDLAGNIAERQTFVRCNLKRRDDAVDESEKVFVSDFL